MKKPNCYNDVVRAMEAYREDDFMPDDWNIETLAFDMFCFGEEFEFTNNADIEKSIEIWRTENAPAKENDKTKHAD